MRTVEIHDWAGRGQGLLERVTSTIEAAPSDQVRSLLTRLPKGVVPEDGTVRIVFAGQYSAGKSSMLKVMTGREDIAVGGGITTQEAHEYDWNGVSIVDTPGVHTELRPDHDAVTYGAISGADLLVFVVTNELFDPHLASHFRKLAIDRDKAHEMLLVVNKMRRCAGGNTPATQEVIREDLRKVLAPFTPEQLRVSFIDAEAALDSASEADGDVARILAKKSGFRAFLYEFNGFVRDKGLAGRYTTSLYTIEQVLQEALAAESTGDTDIDALEGLLLQQRRALVEAQAQIPRSVENRVQQTAASIRRDGRSVADLIHGGSDPKEIDSKLREAQGRIQERADELAERVQETVSQHMEALAERVKQIAESELAKELLPRLVARMEVELADLDVNPETIAKARKVSDVTRQLGQFLIKNSFKATASGFAGIFKLNQYSGTATHNAVKAVGHFFGKSFKPWEAVKWTRAIANAGRVLAVAGTVLTFVLQIKEDADAAKLEVDLRETRSAVRAGFNEVVNVIEMHFDEATGTYVSQTIGQRLAEVDQQLAELRQMQASRGGMFEQLVGLLEETQALIKDMHARPQTAA
jgi:GTP1/Obg family GTP-binding protein